MRISSVPAGADAGPGRIGRALDRLRAALPVGQSLPDRVWLHRHHALLALLWLHAVALPVYGLFQGFEPVHAIEEGGVVAVLAALATMAGRRRRLAAALVSVGLITSSAVLVHLSGGVIEAHFHFFVMIALLTLYEDWVPFLVAATYVVLHHGIAGALDPGAVYNHADAVANPWKWAAIHGLFVAAAGVAGVVAWRLNEDARAETAAAFHRARASERSLAEAQHMARVGSWAWDLTADRVVWSQEMYRILGLGPGEIEPSLEAYAELVVPEDRERLVSSAERSRTEGKAPSHYHRVRRADGSVRTIHARGETALYGPDGSPARLVGTCQDVTEQRRAEAESTLRAAQQGRVAELGERALAGAELFDLMPDAAAAVSEMLAVDITAVLELKPGGEELVLRAGRGLPRGPLGRIRAKADASSHAGFTVSSGSPVVVEDWATEERFAAPFPGLDLDLASGACVPIRSGEKTFGVLATETLRKRSFSSEDLHFLQAVANVLANAIERRAAEERIRHQALHDPLTGLPNRSLMLDRLGHALAKAQRRSGSVAVLFLDLDRFKLVNDSLGHEIGDDLLRAVAPRLKDAIREEDTIARFGGDEFGILLEDVSGELEVTHVAERVASVLARPFIVGGREHFVTASIGIAIGEGGELPDALIRDADAAMYRAKERGGAVYEIFDEVMRARAVEHLRIENDLRRAVERSELRIHYQPIVSLKDGTITAVEALLRWQHPERGLIGPTEFIPIAEEGGLIVPVGRWVLEQACRQAASWHAARPDAAPISVAVNLSGRQLAEPELASEVACVVAGTGIEPASLSLEITESALIEQSGALAATTDGLTALGCKLLLDDFGTGFSSLGYLKRFALSGIKVDRSFVGRLGADPTDTAIIRAIVGMGEDLGLTVTAEGVETAEQVARVQELGCGYAQGFHFARPLPAERIEELLDRPPRWGEKLAGSSPGSS